MKNFFSLIVFTFLLISASGCAKENENDKVVDNQSSEPSVKSAENNPTETKSTKISKSVDKSVDQVIAVVNGKEIKESEFKNTILAPVKQSGVDDAKLEEIYSKMSNEDKRKYLDMYVDQKLITLDGEKSKLEDSIEFKATMAQLKDKVIFEMTMINYLKDKVKEEDVKKFYDDFVAKSKARFDLKLSRILVKTEEKAQQIKDSLAKGQKFSDLAKKLSEDKSSKAKGGDLGLLSIEAISKLGLVEGVYSLKKGEVSNPINTEAGWNIVKLEDKKQATIPSYEKAKDDIQRILVQQLQMQYVKELRAAAKVEIKLD